MSRDQEAKKAYNKEWMRLHPGYSKEWARLHPDVGRASTKKWHSAHKDRWRNQYRNRKRSVVDLLGGCCQRCGYTEFVAALDFHHIIDKDKLISILVKTELSEAILSELDKYVVLCSNCHRGLHAKYWGATWQKREGVGWSIAECQVLEDGVISSITDVEEST